MVFQRKKFQKFFVTKTSRRAEDKKVLKLEIF